MTRGVSTFPNFPMSCKIISATGAKRRFAPDLKVAPGVKSRLAPGGIVSPGVKHRFAPAPNVLPGVKSVFAPVAKVSPGVKRRFTPTRNVLPGAKSVFAPAPNALPGAKRRFTPGGKRIQYTTGVFTFFSAANAVFRWSIPVFFRHKSRWCEANPSEEALHKKRLRKKQMQTASLKSQVPFRHSGASLRKTERAASFP
jgi:hypothetical protein